MNTNTFGAIYLVIYLGILRKARLYYITFSYDTLLCCFFCCFFVFFIEFKNIIQHFGYN